MHNANGPAEFAAPEARTTKGCFMATQKSTAHPAHTPNEDHDDTVEAHYASLERPHACNDGWVYLGVEENGIERTEAVSCRRCAEDRRVVVGS